MPAWTWPERNARTFHPGSKLRGGWDRRPFSILLNKTALSDPPRVLVFGDAVSSPLRSHPRVLQTHTKVTECWGQNVWRGPGSVLYVTDCKYEIRFLSPPGASSLPSGTARGAYDSSFSAYLRPHPLAAVGALATPISRLATPPLVSRPASPCDPVPTLAATPGPIPRQFNVLILASRLCLLGSTLLLFSPAS